MTEKEIEELALDKYPTHEYGFYSKDNELKREGYIRALRDMKDIMFTEYRSGAFFAEEVYNGLPKVEGWITRDKEVNGFWGCGLIFHDKMPTRTGNVWSSSTIAMHLPDSMFPDITWESEPLKVELLIKNA